MSTERRVALIADTSFYVGPDIARLLAARGHDLVVASPLEGLVDELVELGATMPFVDGTSTFTTGQVVNYAGGWVLAPAVLGSSA